MFLVLSLSVRAQNAGGRIVGNVTDPNGASIPDAKITVVNSDTQVHYDTTANKDGYFQTAVIPIGKYNVTIEVANFRSVTYENQSMQINQVLRLDTRLELGSRSEVVEVKDQASV